MKMKTTASSLAESRLKQVVKTSSSLAPLQIGRLYERQKALLHSLQVPRVFFASDLDSPDPGEVGEVPSSCIMVLLVKQVHLQKEVDAAVSLATWNGSVGCHSYMLPDPA